MASMRELARMAAAQGMMSGGGGGGAPGGEPPMDEMPPEAAAGGNAESALVALEAAIPPDKLAEAGPHLEALRALLGGGAEEGMPETAPDEQPGEGKPPLPTGEAGGA